MADKLEKPAQKFFDVSHPGKSTPSSTSRPTIVGHHTILQDPMVNTENENKEAITNTSSIVSRVSTTNIVPSDEAVAGYNSTEKIADTSEPSVEDVKDKVEDEPQVEADTETEKPKTEETELIEPESNEPSEEVDEINIQSTDNTNTEEQKKADKSTKEDLERQEAIAKLIADKTYFAPVGVNKRKSSKRNFVMPIIVALVVVFVAGYLVIDSGIVKTSVKLPVSLFDK